ncbi:hypothetical protein [Falsiruegeria mediterranea]
MDKKSELENKWTRPNRLTEVIRHEAFPETVGESPLASVKSLRRIDAKRFKNIKDGDTIWKVLITTRTGLDKESVGISVFQSE